MMAEDSDKMMSPSAEDNAKEPLGTEEAEMQPNADVGPEQSLSDNDSASEPNDEHSSEQIISERDELKDQLLRLMAETENLRKRTDKEIASSKKYGAVGLARDLLASFDNLEKAVELIPEDKSGLDETVKNILIGVEMTAREINTTLERHGISVIAPQDEKFDYNLHQAMFEVPTNEVEAGMVVNLVQKGYQLHDRLLRPAMVGVSKAAEQAKNEDSSQ